MGDDNYNVWRLCRMKGKGGGGGVGRGGGVRKGEIGQRRNEYRRRKN